MMPSLCGVRIYVAGVSFTNWYTYFDDAQGVAVRVGGDLINEDGNTIA